MYSLLCWTQGGNKMHMLPAFKMLPSIWREKRKTGKRQHYQPGQRSNKQHKQRVLRRLQQSQKEATCISLKTGLQRWDGLTQAVMKPRPWLRLKVCLGGEFERKAEVSVREEGLREKMETMIPSTCIGRWSGWLLCSCSTAALTNYYTIDGSKQHKLTISWFCKSKVQRVQLVALCLVSQGQS